MEVPSPAAGRVAAVKVKVGDKVSEGIGASDAREAGGTADAPKTAPAAAARRRRRDTRARPRQHTGAADIDMPGAGAGRGAGRLFRRLPRRRSRHDHGAGRALARARRRLPQRRLHSVEGAACTPPPSWTRSRRWPGTASATARPKIDLAALRTHKDKVVGKLTTGLAGMAKARKVTVVTGTGRFLDPNHLEVTLADGSGEDRTLRKGDHRRGLGSGEAAVHSRRSAHRRLRPARSNCARSRKRCWSSAAASSASRWRRSIPRSAPRRCRRDARRADARRRPRSRPGVGEAQRAALRSRHAEDQDGRGGGQEGRHPRHLRGRESAEWSAALRHGAGRGRTHAERQS